MPTSDAPPGAGDCRPRAVSPHGRRDPPASPGLVIARAGADDEPFLLWVLMITSAAHRRWSGDVHIPDPASIGLRIPSVVRTAKIATVEAARADPLGDIGRGNARHHPRRCRTPPRPLTLALESANA